ncbi:MAG: ATP-binding protein [Candidatus Aenigmatarchaeota archaeon]
MEDRLSAYIIDKKNEIKLIDVKERLIEVTPTKDFIISVTGPRRSGKTYFLYRLLKDKKLKEEEYIFVNFEEIENSLEEILLKHQEIYGKTPEFLFLDEIQNLKNWEKEVYRVFEKKKYFVFIAGSSSKLLSKEIATQLRGRTINVKIFPFSFKEVLKASNLLKKFYGSEEIGKIRNLLLECLKKGSFPDIVLKKIEASTFMSDYIDLVVYKDIMERYGVKNRVALEFFIKNAIASASSIFSINKVYNAMKSLQIKASKNTIYNFQKFLEDVGTVFFLKKFDRSVRKIETSLPKAYVVDNALYTFSTYKHDISILMENFVFQELLKRNYEPNRNLYYFGNNYEVDFLILEKGKIFELIQVTYSSSKDEIEKREIKSLLKASSLLKCKNLLIITWDYEDEIKIENKKIVFKPLWKWLLF